MPYQNPEIVERERDCILVIDRPTGNSYFEYYSGIPPSRSRARRLAIVLPDRARAEAYLAAQGRQHDNARLVSVSRLHSFDPPPARLRNCVMLYDRYAALDDDAALKRRHPVPEGISVTFRWNAKDQVYQLEALTERNGARTTRTVTLRPLDRDFDAQVQAAYSRFLRTSPSPSGPPGVRCGTHVAALLAGLERPAAAAYAAWIGRIRKAPIHERSSVGRLVLPGKPLGEAVKTLTLEPARGRDEIVATIVYEDAGTVSPTRIAIDAELPETVLESLRGRSADVLWGSAELAGVEIGKRAATGTAAQRRGFDISYRLVAAPDIEGRRSDEARARRVLERNYAEFTYEATLGAMLGALPPSWLLHLLRSLLLAGTEGIDASYVPGAPTLRLRIENRTVRVAEQALAPCGALWREACARAA